MDGNSAVLDCGLVALDSADIEERVRQIMPLLKRLLEADVARMSLSDPILEKRFRGITAQSMIVEAALSSTSLQAELLAAIISGQESIADHGFPEFEYE